MMMSLFQWPFHLYGGNGKRKWEDIKAYFENLAQPIIAAPIGSRDQRENTIAGDAEHRMTKSRWSDRSE